MITSDVFCVECKHGVLILRFIEAMWMIQGIRTMRGWKLSL